MDRTKLIEFQVKKMIADFQERNVDTSIRVFVTFSEKGRSSGFSYGGGDYYSQVGYVGDWLEGQRARTWQEARETPRDEDGEERSF